MSPGEVVALLGPNGAGKTTTIEMLLGLRKPDGGTARVFDLDPRDAVRSGRVGAMMQTGGLVGDVTVREVVHLIAAMHSAPLTVERALELAGITDLAKRKIKTLSGGQRQRVLFALAVVPDPDLIVLDEPTVAMDVETRRAFWAAMRVLADDGRSVLFATHYLEEADANADRIVLHGPRQGCRRRSGHPDQGDGRRTPHPLHPRRARHRSARPAARGAHSRRTR